MSMTVLYHMLLQGCTSVILFLFLGSPVLGSSTVPIKPTIQFELSAISTNNLHKPIFLTHAENKNGRLYIVEQKGKIRILEKGRILSKPFLDISTMLATGGEQGLLGLAFHPNYQKNGRYFINYVRKQDRATVIAEYHRSSNPNRSDTKAEILLVIPHPYGNHNGGMIAFGPDGFLYIGMGDGGAGGDPENRGQNPNELLGKILRIDIDQGDRYQIPSDNPFVKEGGRPEIYAIGFRNPWRFSFDQTTGELWVGDVGQKAWEEIAIVKNGENHGWRLMEGSHCFKPKENCQGTKPLTLPVLEYPNGNGHCSVIGGYVYRGKKIPALQGTYLFADYCSGEIFGYTNGSYHVLLDTDLQVTSFGEDTAGELYVLGHGGSVHKLTPAQPLAGLKQ